MIGYIFYDEGNLAKADHDLVIDAITERLREGSLTEPDRKLALSCYDELRSKLHDAAVQGGLSSRANHCICYSAGTA
ncbi:MAG TPA: hypothetical protein VG675_10445 [Bryobacteraceae bacterium]|nr:hypothetical protein [Bryobacteraceae bacterium]